ncbi:rRNA pseudouridine synthase [Cetobacterium sp. 2A]|uniref:pseudouridine synthase n=1 Tax=Cetobacterium sp. 2A TaxID=2754723 RepID=UPI00163D0DCF|nr:pseudouridine synthase [Cetobacterium sp. 2A]MBC2856774.1 rRNA pseudouridine synthase [Cetobacterium sp. 2A]
MRLDKFLVECGIGSRREVKDLVSRGQISVNKKICKNVQENINPDKDTVTYNSIDLIYKEFRYYVLYKIDGYVTATEDKKDSTVMELLPEWVVKKDLFPVGRLDKDTEGLLLFTNDGKLAHELTSPKKHVDKVYYAKLEETISSDDIQKLEKGVDIGGHITMPAKVEALSSNEINLTIREGKFHQVKKMLIAVNNKVTYLKRIKFGKLSLDNMKPGDVIEINKDDIYFL